MGFGGMLRCGQPKDIDHHLITALIERWRPETHTFHFPVGEATVSLEDVEVLWGLKTDGEPLTGYIPTKDVGYWKDVCLDFLGFIPDAVDLKEMNWKQTSLSNQLRIELSDDHEQYMYNQRARVYCLLLLGGLLIPNATGNKIPFFYLQFFMDIEQCGSYSWGGATLACLYHNLCEAALGKRTDVGGALTLLQLWAWERIPIIRPQMLNPTPVDYLPCAVAWTGRASYVKAPGHCIETFRDQFSTMHANQFIWRPYVNRNLADICVAGRPIWTSMTTLICWNMVEPHMPQRVLRQFGIVQPYIPLVDRFHGTDFTKQDRRGKAGRNWVEWHAKHIQDWHNRHDTVYVDLEYSFEPVATDEYMDWFRRITVVYLTKPGVHAPEGFHETAASHHYAVDTLHKIRHFLREQDMSGRPDLFTISRMVEHGLQICGEAETMDYRPSQRSEMDIEVPVRQKAKRRGKKKVGGQSSSSRMDTQLVDDSDDDFEAPPPPRSAVRGRHSVSHTGGTGEDIGLSDQQSPPRSSVRDDFFDVDLENAVVEDTPPSRIPKTSIGKGIRSLFMRKRRDE
ncbi:serine/threonine-protein phosphatase 7 long form homolog [Salvia splendens]|uniref:serine/threonine-protein phosphatase 7 long form homolog n=2 Tax=Salvia splendens TaxID=180675 RepID=UPI001C25557A|nr:serine/threonine-protein phosphatase 7 long form homolog [Salvia splendens]